MTAPRQIVPGTMYLVTQRCVQRRLLLRPSETINQIFNDCLTHAASKTGAKIYA